MPMHKSRKRKLIKSDKKLKSNDQSEFVKREILIPFYNGEYLHARREIWDYYRHKDTGILLIRVMVMHPIHTNYAGKKCSFYTHWTCEELGGGTAGPAYWIRLAKQTPRKNHG